MIRLTFLAWQANLSVEAREAMPARLLFGTCNGKAIGLVGRVGRPEARAVDVDDPADSPKPPVTEAIAVHDDYAFAGQKCARKSEFWNEEKNSTGSRNGKHLARRSGISCRSSRSDPGTGVVYSGESAAVRAHACYHRSGNRLSHLGMPRPEMVGHRMGEKPDQGYSVLGCGEELGVQSEASKAPLPMHPDSERIGAQGRMLERMWPKAVQ